MQVTPLFHVTGETLTTSVATTAVSRSQNSGAQEIRLQAQSGFVGRNRKANPINPATALGKCASRANGGGHERLPDLLQTVRFQRSRWEFLVVAVLLFKEMW